MNKIDLTIKTISQETIYQSFKKIAEDMLNNFIIEINGVQYRILNIEFYYYNFVKHSDCNVHQHERQLKSHQWYLHKNSINPAYHRKGIDYTFGDGKNYGGILIKTVKNLTTNSEPLSQSNFIKDLVESLKFKHPNDTKKFKQIIEETDNLKLKPYKLDKHSIISKERVNLARPSYRDEKYEYAFYINLNT
ncbi:MAG: hypothetical protein WBF48_03600 [Halarcobacter sp.]